MFIPSNETSFKRTFHWRGTGCSFFLGFFFSIMWSAGSTLLSINNGTDNPCCCFCVPRSQFVLTVGVRGLTGKGNRVNPVPGGIGTWWWAAAHKPSDQMFLVTLWKMPFRLWDRLRQTLLSIITDGVGTQHVAEDLGVKWDWADMLDTRGGQVEAFFSVSWGLRCYANYWSQLSWD